MSGKVSGIYAKRRARVLKALNGGVAILPAAPEQVRSNDTHYPYRQDSDFYYLTGFTEPGAVLVLDAGAPKHRFVLYVQPKNPDMERWTGRRSGVKGARSKFGTDAAREVERFYTDLPTLLKGRDRVFLKVGADPHLEEKITGHMADFRGRGRAGETGPSGIVDISPVLAEMRLFKADDEIALMDQAAAATAAGHLEAMRTTRPGMYEYQVQAGIEYRFCQAGALFPAYATICGSGANATILHYVENNRRMKKGDLLLIDAGAEVGGYAGDVTRTLPVGGHYSEAQLAVYQVVLAAQKAAVRKVKPGISFNAIHQAAVRALTDGLIRLGLVEGPLAKAIKTGAYKRFYMHRTSHWLGLDVHDVGAYYLSEKKGRGDNSRLLEAGMVLTVEPGLYIDPDPDIPAAYRGIGIRIEDDVLVTKDGYRVLTEKIPREPHDIERVMAGDD